MKTRLARFGSAALLSLALLGACSSGEGTDVDCGLDQCTVTFDRGVEANASVLGVEAKLVSVEGDKATIEVAGERLTLTVGQPATDTEVKIKVTR